MRIRQWWLYIVVVCVGLLSVQHLFEPGYFATHDGLVHVMRLAHFEKTLTEGQFPVRWLPTWMGGYGSPVFNFNWSLPYYLATAIHWLGFSFEDSIKTVFILSQVLSGMTALLFFQAITGQGIASLGGAILYMWAPYRFSEIFIRGALGEAFSFVFLPLVLYFVWKLQLRQTGHLGLLITWSLTILTHNVMALFFTVVYFAYLFVIAPTVAQIVQLGKQQIALFLCGVALVAFFWLPAVGEKKYDQVSSLAAIYQTAQQTLPFNALFFSPWQYGYATPNQPEQSMSFQIGWVHAAAVLLLALMILKSQTYAIKFFRRHVLFFIGLFVISLLLTTHLAKAMYSNRLINSVNNFPWRLLEIATFAGAACGALWIADSKNRKVQFVKVSCIVTGTLFLYWSNSQLVSQRYTWSDQEYTKMIGTPINPWPDTEYLPVGVNYFELMKQKGPAYDQPFFQGTGITLTEFKRKNLTYEATITTKQGVEMIAAAWNFPGWKLQIDNQAVSLGQDSFGRLSWQQPAGVHKVRLQFTDTPIRRIATLISLVSLLSICLWFGYRWVKRKITAPVGK